MEYYYKIAGIGIKLDIPFEVEVGTDMLPFLERKRIEADEVIRFVPDCLNEQEKGGYKRGFHRFHNNHSYRYHGDNDIMSADMDWNKGMCRYDGANPQFYKKSLSLWNIIGLETLLIRHNRLLLHASFIRHNNRGILFSAPSGTGKSTQASLWEEYEGAEIINGDRAGLSCDDGTWIAWGLPYAGSSGIYKNESAPVEAIVVLKQAKENRIQRVTPIQAFTYLLPEFNLHRWDEEFMDKALGLINRLIQDVPVYLLECRPDEEAVRVLKAELDGRR